MFERGNMNNKSTNNTQNESNQNRKPIESEIQENPNGLVSLISKVLIVIVALGYLYGFVVVWSAYGSLGLSPFWYPIFLFIPPGLCFVIIVIGFMFAGVNLGGEELKPFTKESNLRTVDSIIIFTNVFIVVELIFIGSDTYFKQLPKNNTTLFVIMIMAIFLLITFAGTARKSGEMKVARIFGGIFVLVNLVFHIWNFSQPMIFLFLTGILLTVLSNRYFTPDYDEIDLGMTPIQKMKSMPNIVAFLIFSLVPCFIFGASLYFHVKPSLGGGAYKPSLITIDNADNEFSSMLDEDSDSLYFDKLRQQLEKGMFEGTIIGKSSDLYFIKLNLSANKYRVIGIKQQTIRAILYNFSPKTVSSDSLKINSEEDTIP